MFRKTVYSVLILLLSLTTISCSKKSNPRKLRTDFLELGKPGEEIKENNIPKSDNVIILNENQDLIFTSDEGEIAIANFPTETLKPGNVIVGNSKNPVLLEVKTADINRNNNGRGRVKTESAPVSKISGDKKASFLYKVTPEWKPWDPQELKKETEGKTEYTTLEDGTVLIKNLELFNINFDPLKTADTVSKILNIKKPPRMGHEFKFNLDSPGSFRAVVNEAKLKFVPTFKTSYEMDKGKLNSAKSRMDTLFTYSVDITYYYSAATDMEIKIPLFPTKKIPVRIPGAVPIYMDVEFSLPAGVNLKTERAGQTRVMYTAEYAFMSDLHYGSETGLNTKADSDYIVSLTKLEVPDSQVAVSAEFLIQPKVTTRLYRVLGPHAYLNPYVRSEVKAPLQMGDDELFVGLVGGVGLQVSEPIFLKELINLDSGPLFDLYRSWDLILPHKDPNPPKVDINSLNFKTEQKFSIDSLGKEGFVVLKLKNASEKRPLTLHMVKLPKNGIVVPAEDFLISGEIYYYPLGKSVESAVDEIEFQFIQDGVKGPVQKLVLQSSPNVIASNQRPRFALTNNSVRVNYASPGEFKDQVSHFMAGPLVGSEGVLTYTNRELYSDVREHSNHELEKIPWCAPSIIDQACHEGSDIEGAISKVSVLESDFLNSFKIKTSLEVFFGTYCNFDDLKKAEMEMSFNADTKSERYIKACSEFGKGTWRVKDSKTFVVDFTQIVSKKELMDGFPALFRDLKMTEDGRIYELKSRNSNTSSREYPREEVVQTTSKKHSKLVD